MATCNAFASEVLDRTAITLSVQPFKLEIKALQIILIQENSSS